MNTELAVKQDLSAIDNADLAGSTKDKYKKAIMNYLATGNTLSDTDALIKYAQGVSKSGRAFLKAYLPVTEKRVNEPWTDADREIQLVKRGRYAEFNLVYDRGTQFGLQTGHNPEAVLMSLPPECKWP